jgi:hypothetical protein
MTKPMTWTMAWQAAGLDRLAGVLSAVDAAHTPAVLEPIDPGQR